MAAPVTTPRDPDLNQSRQPVWFPPGEWFDFFNGERHIGPQWSVQYSSLEDIPLFARAGTILPLDGDITDNGTENPEIINLLVFPGKDGHFTLYEDDGVSQGYIKNGGSSIEFDSFWTDSTASVQISPAVGNLKCIPQLRTYHILFRGVDRPDGYSAKLNGSQSNISMDYDETTHTASVGPIKLGIGQSLTVKIHKLDGSILAPNPTISAAILHLLKLARMETVTKWKISTLIDKLRLDISALIDPQINLTPSHLKALIEIITGVGAVRINLPTGGSRFILLNPNHYADFKYLNERSDQLETCETMVSEDLKDGVFDYFGLIKIKL